jgi:hypothetical protein
VVKEVGSGVNDGSKRQAWASATIKISLPFLMQGFWNYTNQNRATTIFPLLSDGSFKRENAVTF